MGEAKQIEAEMHGYGADADYREDWPSEQEMRDDAATES